MGTRVRLYRMRKGRSEPLLLVPGEFTEGLGSSFEIRFGEVRPNAFAIFVGDCWLTHGVLYWWEAG